MATKRSRSLKLNSKAGNITANATVIAAANITAGTGNGYTGSQGYTGSFGYTGSAGAGYTGSSAAGYTGSAGPAGGYTGSRGDTGYVGSIGGFNSVQSITPVVSNLYTLVASDAGTLLSFTGTTTNSLIVPTDANASIGVGTRIDVTQASTGPVIVSADTGVTLHSVLGAYLNDVSSVGTLIKIGPNEWTFVGPQSAGYTGSASTVIGHTGSIGDTGYVGSIGPIGYTGSQGPIGFVGSSAAGYTGSAGSGVNLNVSWAYLTAGTTSGTGWQKVPIGTVSEDVAGWWDNTNKYFKPTLPGWYLISARARTASSTIAALAIGKNGSGFFAIGNDTNASQIAIGGASEIYLNGTTDYVDLRVFANANGVAYTTGTYDTYLRITGPLQAGPQGVQGYTGSSGSAAAAGGDTQVLFNDAGIIGAQPGLTFDKTTGLFTSTNLAVSGSVTEQVYTIVDGASVDIDPANGTIQLWALGAGRTPTATNFADGQSVTLMVNSGASTVTWSSISVTWVGGSAPTLAVSGYNVIDLWKAGGIVYGASIGTA